MGGGLAASAASIWRPLSCEQKATVLCTGSRVTRHPRMGAVEEPEVPRRERQWNERAIDEMHEKAGVYRLLRVNASGISD